MWLRSSGGDCSSRPHTILLRRIHTTFCAIGTGVGPETAEAVLRVYPTPRSLYEAWLRSRGAAEPSGGFQCRQARAPSASPLRLLEGIEARCGTRARQSAPYVTCMQATTRSAWLLIV